MLMSSWTGGGGRVGALLGRESPASVERLGTGVCLVRKGGLEGLWEGVSAAPAAEGDAAQTRRAPTAMTARGRGGGVGTARDS